MSIEDLDPELVYKERITSLGEIARQYVGPERIELCFTSDLQGEIRRRSQNLWERENYEVERLHGTVGARVMTAEDGTTQVILTSGLLHPDTPVATFERTVTHEFLHVATSRRGESLNDYRERHGLRDDDSAEMLAIAGIACEEFRVERALAGAGLAAEPSCGESADGLIDALRDKIREGLLVRSPFEDLARCRQIIMTAFHEATTLLAYVAGEEVGGGPTFEPPDSRAWRWLAADYYEEFRERLSRLSPASEPTPVDELDAEVEDMAKFLEEWVEGIGFRTEHYEDGGGWFEIDRDRVLRELAA